MAISIFLCMVHRCISNYRSDVPYKTCSFPISAVHSFLYFIPTPALNPPDPKSKKKGKKGPWCHHGFPLVYSRL
ncbi:hypothetical protein BKA57DRAFT_445115 [Linnemannia elongata]|nr:hypothetical protein BKA57DRAFT_445115 [Linnemannia elongata]